MILCFLASFLGSSGGLEGGGGHIMSSSRVQATEKGSACSWRAALYPQVTLRLGSSSERLRATSKKQKSKSYRALRKGEKG